MKILYVVYECYPFFKTGGLADVAYAFPKALVNRKGNEVVVVLPHLDNIAEEYKKQMQTHLILSVNYNNIDFHIIVHRLKKWGVEYYFLESQQKDLYDNCYAHNVEFSNYIFFCKAVIEIIAAGQFCPDVVHLNDWHTALVAYLLKTDSRLIKSKFKVVYTIHNLQYQGIFDKQTVLKALGIKEDKQFDHFKDYALINFMKLGIIYADAVATVSPTYMLEIQNQEYGMGLNELLRSNNHKLFGVLNGLDNEFFNPESDPFIDHNYSKTNFAAVKPVNKKQLLTACFPADGYDKKFVLALVTRLADQKGVDIFLAALPQLVCNDDISIVLIGKGDAYYENQFKIIQKNYPKSFKCFLKFDEPLAHKIYAGADALLVPSYFEPCGLSQLIALAYGTIPIVRKTGGLADTIVDYTQPNGYGFLFNDYSPHALITAVKTAKDIFYHDKKRWEQFVARGMNENFGWDKIVDRYLEIYLK